MVVKIPYGAAAQALDTNGASAELLCADVAVPAGGEVGIDIVRRAMQTPVESPPLWQLAQGKENAALIISDHTRPVPSRDILPPMLQELRRGNPQIDITLLVATGFHRPSTEKELRDKLGDEIYDNEHIVIHHSERDDEMAEIGVLPSGAPLVINKVAAETQLLISEGFIEPHFFAGYSGGRKSVLPGVCARRTVLGNHCAAFIEDPLARAGTLEGNPIHRDMEAAAKMANLQFIVNVIIDHDKKTVAAFAGDALKAHEAGCAVLDRGCKVFPKTPGDIVVTGNGGAPLDQNVYQMVKGLSAAAGCAKEGAVLITCSECIDGHGGVDFYEALRDCVSPTALLEEVKQIPQGQTKPDQWEYQILAQILSKHRVVVVSHPDTQGIIRDMKMEWVPDLQTAWQAAGGQNPGVHTVIVPDGVSVAVGR